MKMAGTLDLRAVTGIWNGLFLAASYPEPQILSDFATGQDMIHIDLYSLARIPLLFDVSRNVMGFLTG